MADFVAQDEAEEVAGEWVVVGQADGPLQEEGGEVLAEQGRHEPVLDAVGAPGGQAAVAIDEGALQPALSAAAAGVAEVLVQRVDVAGFVVALGSEVELEVGVVQPPVALLVMIWSGSRPMSSRL